MPRADHDERRRGPGYGGVILASVLTSALVSAATVYAMNRWGAELLAPAEQAPTSVQVPRVIGMSPETADEILTGRGLRLVVRGQEPSMDIDEGEIAEQTPLPSSRVDTGAHVEVVVSTGMPLIDVPPVVGLGVDEARRSIAQAGLEVGRVSETGQGEPGTVTTTNPPQGTRTTPDTPIALVVVPAGVEVPSVVGQPSRDARRAIEAAGLGVGRVRRRYDEDRGPFIVLDQDPAGGSRVAPGTEVELTVNEGY